jgi:bifunctional non-homologous end joining protein LigD
MLATLIDEAFDNDNWLFEIKWDGYRAIGSYIKGKTELYSRNNISFKERYIPIANALKKFSRDVVVDGEIVSLDENGYSRFQYLQNWQNDPQGTLVYYVFDLLWIDGYDITMLPLVERKKILQQIIPVDDSIRYSDHIEKGGKEFFATAEKNGLEGIIAKNKNSVYQINSRSRDWLKIKTSMRQEVVIAGFTEPRRSRQYFGALVLGVYENGKLKYVGHTGSGFNEKLLKDVWKKMQPLITDKCPFDEKPKTKMPVTWVKPQLVCEIKFQEWTNENILRVPIFMGLRPDKNPVEVKKEKVMPAKSVNKKTGSKKNSVQPAKTSSKKFVAPEKKSTKKINAPAGKEWLNAEQTEKKVTINKMELKLTNLDKIYWKKEGYTKRDLLNYYHEITPYMLPYMKNRPQSLNRHPNGIDGMSFFQKNVEGKVPDWVETFAEFSESNQETIHYFVCTNEASLIYLANLGCIEMNPWHSTTKKPDNPDYCLIDLDPHETNFDAVIETAQAVKKVLDQLKIPAWCKTSGATGLHICIPLGAKYTYDQSRQLAELLANLIHREVPSFTSVERSPSKRRRKVYLDYLQNSKGQTVACVYSARPKAGATVSTPLLWEEVKKGLSPSNFTIKNLFERLKSEGDIFKPVYEKGIDLKKTLEMIEAALT